MGTVKSKLLKGAKVSRQIVPRDSLNIEKGYTIPNEELIKIAKSNPFENRSFVSNLSSRRIQTQVATLKSRLEDKVIAIHLLSESINLTSKFEKLPKFEQLSSHLIGNGNGNENNLNLNSNENSLNSNKNTNTNDKSCECECDCHNCDCDCDCKDCNEDCACFCKCECPAECALPNSNSNFNNEENNDSNDHNYCNCNCKSTQ
eukprot:TRINITY_DN2832_c0_g2_i4.p1 TRINITY_DN2832_c0_g2~~TRINITY_DN2832_c0_g2_i4.p1  ORF type:complete len:203 (-),score=94.03 TRINITY_DN2832_c0_g2_i4:31-639(-)